MDSYESEVAGSIPVVSIVTRDSSDGRATDCSSVGRVFESLSRDYYIFSIGDVAQMVEHLLSMREVGGSMPLVSTHHVGGVV